MATREAEVVLEALNRVGEEGATAVGLLKQRLGAVRVDMIGLKAQVEAAKAEVEKANARVEQVMGVLERKQREMAHQEERIATLDRLLKEVYASRSYRVMNWLHGKLSAVRTLLSLRRQGPR